MTSRLWLRISAVYFGLLGVASLAAPQTAAEGLDQAMTSFDLFATRTVGAILIAFALADWMASTQPRAGMLLANIFLNAALAVIDIAAILDETISAGGWSGVAAHLVLLTGLLVFLIRRPQPRRPSHAS